jgi:hypothetical protein
MRNQGVRGPRLCDVPAGSTACLQARACVERGSPRGTTGSRARACRHPVPRGECLLSAPGTATQRGMPPKKKRRVIPAWAVYAPRIPRDRHGQYLAALHCFGPSLRCIAPGCDVAFDAHQAHPRRCLHPVSSAKRGRA